MASNISGINSYKQVSQNWNSRVKNDDKNIGAGEAKDGAEASAKAGKNNGISAADWKPVSATGALVPTAKEGYGAVIGDVNLSDKAKEYYDKLKGKFNGMDFILVSRDLKSQVAARASSYGNASKMVVLIDEDKLERMAEDEAYRKKYEGLIAMAQNQVQDARKSMVSSGANVKNVGVSFDENGNAKYFAVLEKAGEAQRKHIEKKQEEKKALKAEEKKQAKKEEMEERLNRSKAVDKKEAVDKEDAEYIEFTADSLEALIEKISKYAYNSSINSVRTEGERALGQSIDFRG